MPKLNSRKQRETKWDWKPHLGKLHDLYFNGSSIPDIHKNIQCEGFNPCQRAVYDKFNEMGLPTGHDRGSRVEMSETICAESLEDTTLVGGDEFDSVSKSSRLPSAVTTPQSVCSNYPPISTLPVRQRMPLIPEELQGGAILKAPECEEARPPRDIGGDPRGQVYVNDFPAGSSPNLKRGKKEKPARRKESDLTAQEKHDIICGKLVECGFIDQPKPETEYERMVRRARRSGSPPLKRLRRIFGGGPGPADGASGHWSMASSSTGSSGWQSSVFSRPSRPESIMTQAESVVSDWEAWSGTWDNRLIQCHQSHDYGNPSDYRDLRPCRECGFSKVHNLAAFASCLLVAEFKTEIKLMSLLELQAVDAAGNTALHYAAAAGASVAHLKALIEAGISYSCQNTGKENFLHCLRPAQFRSQSRNQDCFEMGLDQLLKLLDPKLVFDHQDNNGRTVIQALASHINNGLCRQSTFDLFKRLNLGSFINVIDRWGKSAKVVWPLDYQKDTDLSGSVTFKTFGSATPEWNGSPIERAHENIEEARKNPFYVDRQTKDNALHSLARLNTHGEVRRYPIADLLAFFVSRGVNLNHHNREGHHPLSAFICYQFMRSENGEDETGATTARFLKIMLSKTGKLDSGDDLNKINVDMMNRRGATAMHEAAYRGQWECVNLLLKAGANVHARLNDDPNGWSILTATRESLHDARMHKNVLLENRLQKVLYILKCAKAVENPSSLQQRGTVGYN